MLKIFIGWDQKEQTAYHVLAHSIIARASGPVAICPLNRSNLTGIYDRPRAANESTDFSLSRFLVPYLSHYDGMSIFMDCDMVCLADIYEIFGYIEASKAVNVVQHNYAPKTEKKFLGQAQSQYPMKNWSSLMVFDNKQCRDLTPAAVNEQSGLWLHQFQWAPSIGALPLKWNWLIDEYDGVPDDPKILHYTLGGPWFPEYANCTGAQVWRDERARMLTT